MSWGSRVFCASAEGRRFAEKRLRFLWLNGWLYNLTPDVRCFAFRWEIERLKARLRPSAADANRAQSHVLALAQLWDVFGSSVCSLFSVRAGLQVMVQPWEPSQPECSVTFSPNVFLSWRRSWNRPFAKPFDESAFPSLAFSVSLLSWRLHVRFLSFFGPRTRLFLAGVAELYRFRRPVAQHV